MGVGSLRLEFQVVDLPYMGARNHPWVLWEQVRLIKELLLQPYGSVRGYSSECSGRGWQHHSWSWFNRVKPRREGETSRGRDSLQGWSEEMVQRTGEMHPAVVNGWSCF